MRVRFWETLALVLAVALLVALAVSSEQAQRAQLSRFSTYDTGPNGYRALFDVLQREGVPVQRSERELGLLDPTVHTLVVSSIAPEAAQAPGSGLRKQDVTWIVKFVERGGRLIVLDPDTDDFERAIGMKAKRVPAEASSAQILVSPLDGQSVHAKITRLYRFDAYTDALPLLATKDGVVALERRRGKGVVVSILAPDLFSNRVVGTASNAAFAYALLADGKPIAFEERMHGFAQDKSFWAALPQPVHIAIWIVCAIVLLALIDANVRFIPPAPLEPPDERDSTAYIVAMAALMRRARAGKRAIGDLLEDVHARMRRRGRIPQQTQGLVAELEGLSRLERPDDLQVLRAAHLSVAVRKDLA